MNYKLLLLSTFVWIAFIGCNNTTKKPTEKSTEEIKIEKIDFVKKVDITGNTALIFKKEDPDFNLYYEAFLKVGNKEFPIEGFDNVNRSEGNILALSPNGKYFIMDYLSIGYVDKEGKQVLYENYFCVVVDIKNKRILHQMQSDCGGEWNAQNQWLSGGKVVVTFD